MSKKGRRKGGMGGEVNKTAVFVCNIIIALVCVASIVTLALGTFWSTTVKIVLTKDTVDGIMAIADSDETKSETPDDFSAEDFLQYIDDDFHVEISADISLDGKTLLGAAFGQDVTATVKGMVEKQLGLLVDNLSASLESILNLAIKAIAQVPIAEAKEEIKEELKKGMQEGADASDEEVMQKMEEEYGISEEDLDGFVDDFTDTLSALLDGDTAKGKEVLVNSDVLLKLVKIGAEDALREESGDPNKTFTPEEIDAKAAALKDEIIKGYDETIDHYSVNGEFSVETAMVVMLEETGMFEGKEGEGSSEVSIKSIDDVKAYISEQIMSSADGETISTICDVLKYIGYFLLFVMATWAYLLLKLLVRLFTRRKTVSMSIPRIFGWMPHVFLVGLPNLLVKGLQTGILDKVGESIDMTTANAVLEAIQLNCTSLTWVSALGTAILMVLSFYYHHLRKQEKERRKK